MIEVHGLTHHFPGVDALQDVSLHVKEGSITALIGPNGSGKTTLLRCISTLQPLQSGHITVGGINIQEHPRQVHRMLGYLADDFGLYEDLTVRQCLAYALYSRVRDASDTEKTIAECAKDTGVYEFIDRKVNTLSRGMRQRAGIAQAIIHKPEVVLLDEPASGLDPEARISLSAYLKSLRERGITLLVSSHILSELEDYCTDMIILREGRVMEQRTIHTPATTALLEFRVTATAFPEMTTILLGQQFPSLGKIRLEQDTLYFAADPAVTPPEEILRYLVHQDIPVTAFSPVKRNLQEEYMNTVNSNPSPL